MEVNEKAQTFAKIPKLRKSASPGFHGQKHLLACAFRLKYDQNCELRFDPEGCYCHILGGLSQHVLAHISHFTNRKCLNLKPRSTIRSKMWVACLVILTYWWPGSR